MDICDALRDLVAFVQFKKHEKHSWRSVKCLLKVTLLRGCFSCFLNCTNGTKLHNASHLLVRKQFVKFAKLVKFNYYLICKAYYRTLQIV